MLAKGTMTMYRNRLKRGLSAIGIAGFALGLSGCLAGSMPSPEMASAKLPVVQQSLMVFDLGGAGDGGLSSEQRRSLSEWFDTIGIHYGDRISLDDAGPGAGARRAAVEQVLSQYGLLLSDEVPVTAGGGSPRVLVMRATASVPDCPDWSRRSNPEFEASKLANYGCANASNLAAMVVDANDLVSGRSYIGTDAITTVKAIDTYRSKAGTGTQKVKNSVGQVSGNGN
jgi:pilus assembly protein CpaD